MQNNIIINEYNIDDNNILGSYNYCFWIEEIHFTITCVTYSKCTLLFNDIKWRPGYIYFRQFTFHFNNYMNNYYDYIHFLTKHIIWQ